MEEIKCNIGPITIRDIIVGDYFRFEGAIYMRALEKFKGIRNAVHIKSGELHTFDATCVLMPVAAALVIE